MARAGVGGGGGAVLADEARRGSRRRLRAPIRRPSRCGAGRLGPVARPIPRRAESGGCLGEGPAAPVGKAPERGELHPGYRAALRLGRVAPAL